MNKHKFLYLAIILVAIGGGILGWVYYKNHKAKITYETQKAEKGTLTTSVSASGTIASSNTYSITTEVTGKITKIYVKNGDEVAEGDKIAEIEMDASAEEKQSTLYSSYLSAKNKVAESEQSQLSMEAQIAQSKSAVLDAQSEVDNKNNGGINPATKQPYTESEKQSVDLKLEQAQKNLELAEEKYTQSDTAIILAKTQQSSAWLSYHNYSTTIKAPAGGKIISLNYEEGDTITASQSSSSTSSSTANGQANSSTGTSSGNSSSISSSSLGTIIKQGNNKLQAKVNITEVDVAKVKKDQKATVTIDAISDKTFTAKVLSIDTTGSVSSGVTTYTAIIEFDENIENVYSNMNITAQIITSIKNDVILISSSAITTSNEQSVVQILKSGQPVSVNVETGDANDSQTEIKSGLSEGDEVIIKINDPSEKTTTNNSTSVFGTSNRSSGASSGGLNSGGAPPQMMGR